MPSLKAFRLQKISTIGIMILCMLITACTDSSNEPTSSKQTWEQRVAGEQITEFLDFQLDLQLPLSDWPTIQQGLIPQTQDERWLILQQDNVINFYRSHTAKLIFQCTFEKTSKQILISHCRMNQDSNATTLNSISEAQDNVFELLSVLVGRSVH